MLANAANPRNVGSQNGLINQGHYVNGVGAGLCTTTNQLGFVAVNVRVMAANSILDRGWGKPAQTTTTTVNDKRSLLDWSTDELLAIVERGRSDGADEAETSDAEPDQVH